MGFSIPVATLQDCSKSSGKVLQCCCMNSNRGERIGGGGGFILFCFSFCLFVCEGLFARVCLLFCIMRKPLVFYQGTDTLKNEISSLPYVPKVLILHHLLFFWDTLYAENLSDLRFLAQTYIVYLSWQKWSVNETNVGNTF